MPIKYKRYFSTRKCVIIAKLGGCSTLLMEISTLLNTFINIDLFEYEVKTIELLESHLKNETQNAKLAKIIQNYLSKVDYDK